MQKATFHKYLKKLLKIIAWIVASFLLLFVIIAIVLQFSSVQTFLTEKITRQVSQRVDTRVKIDRVAIRFPKSVGLKGIYLEDTRGDTLLYAGSIFVNVGMTALLRSEVKVANLELTNIVANMKREEPDTVFNYQFLIDAFAPTDTTKNASSSEKTSDEEPGKQEGGWTVSIDELSLEDIRFRNIDHFTGLDLQLQLDKLNADLKPADLMNEKYHAGEISISQPLIAIEMTPPSEQAEPDTADNGMPELNISLAALILENADFHFNSFDGTQMHIDSEWLALHPEEIKLHEYYVAIETFETEQLMADFSLPPTSENSQDDKKQSPNHEARKEKPSSFRFDFAEIMEWNIVLNNLDITESSFSMKQGDPGDIPEFNPENISLSDINLHLTDAEVKANQLRMAINNTSMVFSDEFQIEDFNMEIDLGSESEINLQNLNTGQSRLSFRLNTPGSLLDFTQDQLTEYRYQLSIRESHIRQDLAWFVPVMNEYYFNWPDSKGIRMGAQLEGKLADVRIDSLWIAGPDFFATELSGQITGLPHTDSLYVDVPAFRFFAVPESFFANLPDSLQPQGFEIPEYINLKADATGSMEQFDAGFSLRSDMGDFSFSARLEDEGEGRDTFEADLHTESFDFGELLQQTSTFPEPVAFRLEINGTGTQPQTMTLEAKAGIENLKVKSHAFDRIVFHAALADSVASLESNYRDSILYYDLEASYGVFQQNPELTTLLELEYAHLQALGVSEENLLVKTDLKTDLIFDTPDFFNGEVQISNTSFATEEDIYNVPEIFIEALTTHSDYEIALRSQFADFDYRGNFSPTSLGTVLNNHFAQHLEPVQSSDTIMKGEEKFFNINVRVTPNELLTEVLFKSLGESDTLDVMATYDSSIQDLYLEANWPDARYENIEIDSLRLSARSQSGKIDFNLKANRLSMGDIAFHQFKTTGEYQQQVLDFGLGFQDNEKPLYQVNGNVQFTDSLYRLQIDPEKLLINAEEWSIPEKNQIAFGTEYINIENFVLKNNDKELSLSSREHEQGYFIVDIGMDQIDLGKLTRFAGSEFPTLGGVFNGEVSLKRIFSDPAFVADLGIKNFAFQGDTLGDIELTGENPSPEYYELMASLQSQQTDMVLTGNYRTGEDKGIDIEADLSRINLSSFEGFTAENITQLEGYVSGNMGITGTLESPEISGNLQMNEIYFRVPAINSGYFIKDEEIRFDNQQIKMQDFALEDSTGRKATLSGSIDIARLNQIDFDLNLSSRDFLLMNAQEEQNELYHGHILIDSDLRLTGTQQSPTVEGSIKLNEGSNFTFTLPQTTPESIGDEGVVKFTPFTDTLFFKHAQQTMESQQELTSFDFLDLNMNVEINRETDIKIIIDEYAGDFLQVRGGGVLSASTDPSGNISLSGRYEIVDGEYLLTFYDVIRRNFKIESGSSLVWSGDPMNARVDITALYTVRTHAADLLAGQSDGNQDRSAAMRQEFPFQVYLKMDDNLEQPNISFELDLPQEHQNALDGSVMARLNQINQNESDLNKQVFALLILGQFIQDNPFASAGGGGFSTTARSSASQIMTQQLNRLSDRYVRGVNIDFQVESFENYEDEQATGRTQLQMEVSRDFLDERLRITVGGNIELEDETRRQENPSDIAGDFSIEYLLTPEGNLILKGFRNKNYGDIFDGEVIDTGISLMFSQSYNQFRELFRKKEEEKEEDSTGKEDE
ncbi:MAG: translocation/assembly module TamB domain-containing protein [bacterium]